MTRAHPRRIPWLLAAATIIPIVVLGGLGIRVLRQDRDVERQRRREALEVAGGRLVLDVERRLQEIEERLTRGAGVVLAADGPESVQDVTLLYRASSLEDVTDS